MSVPTVICDKCSESFALELKERPVSGGGAEQRFRCPHCRTWFSVAFITATGIRIRQQIKAVEVEIKGQPDDEALRARLADLRTLMRAEVRGPND
ncbi:MAG: hypothetical protein AB7R40_22245 [Nitrospiraceae bacterium]